MSLENSKVMGEIGALLMLVSPSPAPTLPCSDWWASSC
jgi:uncharacterized membrane protein